MTDTRTAPSSHERSSVPALVVALMVSLVGMAWSFSVQIEPDQFAVKQVFFGLQPGVQEGEVYGPGWHVVLPGIEELIVFPSDLQTLDFNDRERNVAKSIMGEDYSRTGSIRIQTSEGYQVEVDATILYRVIDPYIALTRIGPGRLFDTDIMQTRADKSLREALGALNAEDFYNDRLRMQKVEQARQALQADLADWGLQVWGVTVREYRYDARYQQTIEQRKIQDQLKYKNEADQSAADRMAVLKQVEAEGQASVDVETESGLAEAARITADADLYYRERLAEGDKLVALARAEGTRLENDALKSDGAEHLVGIEMARSLDGVEVIMLPTNGESGVNPLNLDELAEGF